MQKGDIVLANVPMSDASFKLRPVLLINTLPPYNDWLVCGISSQIHQHIPGVTYLLLQKDNHFKKTGLLKSSVVRINYLAVIPERIIAGKIGIIPNPVYKTTINILIGLINK